jgi:ABC-type antimicrobial peptide transport system permease subunit
LVGLTAISAAFDGAVTGTLLGDAVSVQVRATDYVAAAIAVLLGAFTVADMLYINIRERSGEYALLHATGWDDSALTRLLLTEAATMATVGALVGGGVAIGAVTAFSGEFPRELALAALGVGAIAVLFTLAAALIPALALRRIPAARLLAED